MAEDHLNEVWLGAFRLVRPIAEGGMAVVWGGLHGTELPVAVKVLTGGDLRAPLVRAVFRNEVRAVAKLAHPGIISILDFGEVDRKAAEASEGRLSEGSPYLVMEYATGGALGKRKRTWSYQAVRRLSLALLDGLAHAHSRGVVHRDLKPGNILLAGPDDLHGGIKLTDFGIAWVGGGKDLEALAGTVQYMAPEQHSDDYANFGPWTDLYGLGCVLWRFACGQTPFAYAGKQVARAHLFDRPPDFAPRFPVPPGFEAWIRTLLHKDPQARYMTAADARAALGGLPELDSDDTTAEDLGDQDDDNFVTEGGDPPPHTGRPPQDERRPTAVAPIPTDWRQAVATRMAPKLQGAGLKLFALREIPLFGRERQRDLLWKGMRGVHDEGRPRVVLVRGPSGCGKTRLVEWIAQQANELAGIQTLWVRGDDVATGVGALLGIERLTGNERVEQIADRVRDAGAEAWIPALCSGLAGDVADPQAFRTAVRRLLDTRAIDRPAMLVIDDAHQADEALELAREVATPPDSGRRAVLVVLLGRDDEGLAERPDVEQRIAALLEVSRAKALRLGPLEGPAMRDLLEYLGLSGPLAARVGDRSQGNPQFAIQLVEDWIAQGLLAYQADGFGLADGQSDPPIPDGLHEVWRERIQRLLQPLPGIAAIHLERAAALGVDINSHEWDVVCDDPQSGRVSEAGQRLRALLLESLLAARLVEVLPGFAGEAEQGVTGEQGSFRFAHPMVRECVERMSRKAGRWAGHHHAVATVLETSEPPDLVRTGFHWLEAGHPDRAVDYLLEGMEDRVRRGGFAQVAGTLLPLERALYEARVPGDDLRWAKLWCRQAGALRGRGLVDEAREHTERALHLTDQPGTDEAWSECTRELARLQQEEGDVPGALVTLQKTVARLVRAEAKGRELVLVLARMAVLARMMNQLDDAERWATQGTGVIARGHVEDPGLEGYLIGELAVVANRRGQYERALELFDTALPLLRGAAAPTRLAEVENNRGDACKQLGRWREAEAAFLEAARILESVGATPDIPKINLALCAIHDRRWEEARRAAHQAALIGSKVNAALAILARSVCDAALGDLASVGRTLPPALETLRRARFIDPDAAWLAETGAERALSVGAVDVAGTFAYFGREQWAAMADETGINRVSRLLVDIDVKRRRG